MKHYKPRPSFKNPPLDEVALAFFFDPIPHWGTQHFAALWRAHESQFATWEEHQPAENTYESFDLPSVPRYKFSLSQLPPLRRQWFITKDSTELIQIQDDRLVRNWRRVTGEETYPRYEKVRAKFKADVDTWLKVLERGSLKVPAVSQCEVTYINHLDKSSGWKGIAHASDVLVPVKDPKFKFLTGQDTFKWQETFKILDEQEKPTGRLYAEAENRFRSKDQEPLLRLRLTARGRPLSDGIDGAFNFLDEGREWIVRAFADLTTAATHKLWGINHEWHT